MPFFIIPLIFLSASIIEDPLFTDCSGDNYTVNGPFQTNLKQILNTLPSITSPTGFNNASIGEFRDKVYGQALCRGDVSSTVCQSCVENASREILKRCRSREAIIWYQLCQVHYSYQNFFGSNVYTGKYPTWNEQEKGASDPVHFKQAVEDLLHNLSVEAVYKLAKHKFATGEVRVSEGETIYGLVQCTRDISSDDCFNCLQSASEELIDQGKQGGILLSRNCNVRFELNRFYNVSGHRGKTRVIVYVVFASTAAVLAYLCGSCVLCLRHKRCEAEDEEKSQKALLQELAIPRMVTIRQEEDFESVDELLYVDLATIRVATNNFSHEKKLGSGEFGAVYKGILPDGREIAVKRLSRKSWQGLEEFKNEVTVIAQLQHRNVVRLLGCGMEGEEKLLIYEFMPNKSLDTFIFDSEKRAELNWRTCYNIIGGIARGLLYLHEDSRLRIIHRDLKPGNILLDHDMVAKISDFGMARIFGEDQSADNTGRVIGTHGYMAPEYAMEGLFSTKSDVFSFGVIVLEVISGKRNSCFYITEHAQTILNNARRLWNEGKELELVDPVLMETITVSEVARCIHIGLLCVQEDPENRPPMSSVVPSLGSEQVVLPQPKQPAFSVSRIVSIGQSSSDPTTPHITVSSISPR